MKKIFFIFVLLSCFAAGFAETGYDGIEWGTKRDSLKFSEGAQSWKEQNLEVVAFSTVILGRSTIKSFLFNDQKLDGVAYSFIKKDLPELLKKFDNNKKVYEIPLTIDYENDLEYIIKNSELPAFAKDEEYGAYAFKLIIAQAMSWELCRMAESEGYKKIEAEKQAKEKLFIYDYNNNTRVYILTGGMQGLGFVVYVPHSKDY